MFFIFTSGGCLIKLNIGKNKCNSILPVTMFFSMAILLLGASVSATDVESDQDLRTPFYQSTWNQNCICLAKNKVHNSVPLLLDSERNGLERLVVFIYYNTHTGKMMIFIPNSKIQEMFPNIPLTSNNDLLIDMFEFIRNIHKYNVHNVHLNPATYIDSVYGDTMHGNSIYSTNTIEEIELSYPYQDIHHVTNINVHPIPDPVHHAEELMFPYNAVSELPTIESVDIPEMIIINKPIPKTLILNPHKDIMHVVDPHGHAHAHPDDSMLPSWINVDEDLPSNLQDYEWDFNSVVGDVSHNHYFNEIVANSDYVYNPQMYLDSPILDQWIIREVTRFKHLHLPRDQDIDLNTVKRIIKNTLIKNRITVIGSLLIDSEGNIYNISDLEMKPVILDIPVNYYRLLKESAANLRFAGNPHHLQILLVSLGNQPKVLLSIPLGKIALADEGLSAHQHFEVPLPTPVVSPQVIKKVFISQPSLIHLENSLKTATDDEVVESVEAENQNVNEHSRTFNENKDDPIERAKNVMEKFRSLVTELRYGSGGTVSDVQESYPPSSNATDLEPPSIKIIGGSAATGSGTPINNRGRSGASP